MIMKDNTKLQSLSDNELLRRLSELLQNSRRVEADLIGHIAEVDRRRLYARHSPSLFELVAELNPRPDVPPTIRKLPERPSQTKAPPSDRPQLGPDRVGPISSAESKRTDAEVNTSVKHQQASAPTQPAEVKPLSPARFKVAFTASAELCDKLERLQALMRASGDSADLASVIDAAVTEKLEKLEAKRYGTTKSPERAWKRRTRLLLPAIFRLRSDAPFTRAIADGVPISTLRAGVAPKPSSSSFTTSSPSGGAATTAPRTSASRAVPITPCLPSATTAKKS